MPKPASEQNSLLDLTLASRFDKYYQFMPYRSSMALFMVAMGAWYESLVYVTNTSVGNLNKFEEVQNTDE